MTTTPPTTTTSKVVTFNRPASVALTVSLSAAFALCTLYFGRLLWRRRHIMPIRGRLVDVMLYTAVVTNLWSMLAAVSIIMGDNYSCLALVIGHCTLCFMGGGLYLIRCVVIMFKCKLTEHRMEVYVSARRMKPSHAAAAAAGSSRNAKRTRDSSILMARLQSPDDDVKKQDTHPSNTAASGKKEMKSSKVGPDNSLKFIVPAPVAMSPKSGSHVPPAQRSPSNAMKAIVLQNKQLSASPRQRMQQAQNLAVVRNKRASHSSKSISKTRTPSRSPTAGRHVHAASASMGSDQLQPRSIGIHNVDDDDQLSASEQPSPRRSRGILFRSHRIPSVAASSNWYVRNQWLVQARTLRVLYAVMLVVLWSLLLVFLLHYEAPPVDQDPNVREMCNWPEGSMVLTVSICVVIIPLLVFGVRLREVVEGFYIKRELKLTAVTYLVSVAIWAPLQQVDGYFPASTVTSQIGLFAGTMISICYPLYLSYKTERSVHAYNTDDSGRVLRSLEQVLGDPEAKELFRKWLFREFADENLMFLDTVNAWLDEGHHRRHEKHPNLLISEAHAIVAKFFHPGAELEVCMPSSIGAEIRALPSKASGSVDPQQHVSEIFDLFRQARQTTMEVLRRDPFQRFAAMSEDLRELRERRQEEAHRSAQMHAFASTALNNLS